MSRSVGRIGSGIESWLNKSIAAPGTFTVPPFELASLSNSLMAYWELEEASGSRAATFGGQALTDNSSVVSAAGISGSAASFPTAGFLSHAQNTAVQPGLSGFGASLSIWFKRSAVPTGGSVGLASNDLSNPSFGFRALAVGTAGRINVFTRDSGNNILQATSTLNYCDDAWHQAVWTYSSSTKFLYLYVDGSVVGSNVTGTGTGTLTNNGGGGLVGKDSASRTWNADNVTRAYLDEVGIWDRDLIPSEVTHLWNSGAGKFY